MKHVMLRATIYAVSLVSIVATASVAAASGYSSNDYFAQIDCQAAFLPIEGSEPTAPFYVVDQNAIAQFPGIPGMTAHTGVYDSHDVYNPAQVADAGFWIGVPDTVRNRPLDLLVYAHGFRNPVTGAGVPTPLTFNGREAILENGAANAVQAWAVANDVAILASTYAKNGYVPTQGALDTCELVKYFAANIENFAPGREIGHVFVYGESMGGGVAIQSAERYGDVYSGALPVCGVVGDFYELDHLLDVNYTAQYLGTGSFFVPTPASAPSFLGLTVPTIQAALGLASTNSSNPTAPLALTTKGQVFREVIRETASAGNPVYDQGFNYWFGNALGGLAPFPGFFLFEFALAGKSAPAAVDFPNGTSAVSLDNSGDYEVDADFLASNPAYAAELNFLNSQPRITPEPGGRPSTFLVTGDLQMPVLTLHNLGDLFVPFEHEVILRDEVAARGQTELLSQRAIRSVGHCDFTDGETIDAIKDLVKWIKKGKPAKGDKIEKVMKPHFGCKFTDESGTRLVPSADIPACDTL